MIDYFLRSNILKKISSKISSRRLPPKKSVSSVCSVDKFQMIPPKPSLDPHYSWVIAPPAAPVITSSITLRTYSATRFQLILILVVFKYKNRISCINLSCGYLLPLQSATRVLFRRIPTSHRLEVGSERLIAIHRDGT